MLVKAVRHGLRLLVEGPSEINTVQPHRSVDSVFLELRIWLQHGPCRRPIRHTVSRLYEEGEMLGSLSSVGADAALSWLYRGRHSRKLRPADRGLRRQSSASISGQMYRVS